ncbi:hypothetical protein [Pseudomonas sp. KNUC1026]|uniref:hypothetical protein n=1 Tax=Pseudomonas sp. KNUC1026 TaxID=2893890 RepID=UPI003FA75AD7
MRQLNQLAGGQLLATGTFQGTGGIWHTAGLIASDGDFSLELGAALNNSGRLFSGQRMQLRAAELANHGTLAAGTELQAKAASLVNNHGLITSGGRLELLTERFVNRYADVFSLGDLFDRARRSRQLCRPDPEPVRQHHQRRGHDPGRAHPHQRARSAAHRPFAPVEGPHHRDCLHLPRWPGLRAPKARARLAHRSVRPLARARSQRRGEHYRRRAPDPAGRRLHQSQQQRGHRRWLHRPGHELLQPRFGTRGVSYLTRGAHGANPQCIGELRAGQRVQQPLCRRRKWLRPERQLRLRGRAGALCLPAGVLPVQNHPGRERRHSGLCRSDSGRRQGRCAIAQRGGQQRSAHRLHLRQPWPTRRYAGARHCSRRSYRHPPTAAGRPCPAAGRPYAPAGLHLAQRRGQRAVSSRRRLG